MLFARLKRTSKISNETKFVLVVVLSLTMFCLMEMYDILNVLGGDKYAYSEMEILLYVRVHTNGVIKQELPHIIFM